MVVLTARGRKADGGGLAAKRRKRRKNIESVLTADGHEYGGRMTEASPRKTRNILHAGAATPSSRLAAVGEWNATFTTDGADGRRFGGQMTESWSRDALVAVGERNETRRGRRVSIKYPGRGRRPGGCRACGVGPPLAGVPYRGRRVGRKEAQGAQESDGGRRQRAEGSGWPTEDAEYSARWSRDALVAVGRGLPSSRFVIEMKRDEGVASPANIRA